jgi:effector-binding domain-containing protein
MFGAGNGAIAQYLGEQGEQPIGPPFAAYYNMDMDNLDVEFGFPVARPLPGQTEIKAGEIAGGQVATCLYTDPYSEIEPAYTTLTKSAEGMPLGNQKSPQPVFFSSPRSRYCFPIIRPTDDGTQL